MSALDVVARTGVPHALLLVPGSVALAKAAEAAGLQRADDARLMRFDSEPDSALPQGLRTRLIATSEIATHVRIAAEAFEAPVEVFQALADTVSGQPEVITMLGDIGAEPVTTAQGLVQGDSIGVFSVATPPAYRGRGLGTAITAAVVDEGRRRGARWAWLQASEQGYGVYQRLGFRPVGTFECWTGRTMS
jgi:GNAT superfamily N-acetyltransferase